MRSASRILSLTVLGFALIAIGLGISSPVQADDGVPLPHPAKAFKGEHCLEPVSVMRRNHMKFLLHQRDRTLRQGIRGEKYSLKQCVDCHAVKSPDVMGGKVRTVKPFCSQCHTYAAVSIDCFSCHTGAADDKAMKQSALPADHELKASIAALEKHLNQDQGEGGNDQ